MGSERSGPCRHAGSPPEAVIERVSRVIETLNDDTSFLANRGLTAEGMLARCQPLLRLYAENKMPPTLIVASFCSSSSKRCSK